MSTPLYSAHHAFAMCPKAESLETMLKVCTRPLAEKYRDNRIEMDARKHRYMHAWWYRDGRQRWADSIGA